MEIRTERTGRSYEDTEGVEGTRDWGDCGWCGEDVTEEFIETKENPKENTVEENQEKENI